MYQLIAQPQLCLCQRKDLQFLASSVFFQLLCLSFRLSFDNRDIFCLCHWFWKWGALNHQHKGKDANCLCDSLGKWLLNIWGSWLPKMWAVTQLGLQKGRNEGRSPWLTWAHLFQAKINTGCRIWAENEATWELHMETRQEFLTLYPGSLKVGTHG